MAVRGNIASQYAVFYVSASGTPVTGAAASFSRNLVLFPSLSNNDGAGTWSELDAVNLPGYYAVLLSNLTAGIPITERTLVVTPRSSNGTHVFTPAALVFQLAPEWEQTMLKNAFDPVQHSLASIRATMTAGLLPIVRDD